MHQAERLKTSTIFIYLAHSYCFMVINVSSIVLLHKVLTDETKKLSAFKRLSPFFDKHFWVSEFCTNSCCSSGDFWPNSANASPSDCFIKIKINLSKHSHSKKK